MPITAASNGVRPEIRALAVFKLNKPVTPKAINDCVGTGDYAAKYVSFLNTRYGFTITAQKDGRRVVSYTMIAEPKNAADLRSSQPKAKKVKVAKTVSVPAVKPAKAKTATKVTAKAAAAKTKTPEEIKAANLATMKKVSEKQTKSKARVNKFADEVENALGSTGEVATSFAIDPAWDSVEPTSIPDFLR